MISIVLLGLAGLVASCSQTDTFENPEYSAPQYSLVMKTNVDFRWNVNGEELEGDSIDVTGLSQLEVFVELSDTAGFICELKKGKYPINYKVVSCYPRKEYHFTMEID